MSRERGGVGASFHATIVTAGNTATAIATCATMPRAPQPGLGAVAQVSKTRVDAAGRLKRWQNADGDGDQHGEA
jgi:hypothetical protein